MAVMTNTQLAEKCTDIAKNYKTIYVMGCFGAPLNGTNVQRYCTNHTYNKQRDRKSLIKSVANKGYFGFDCVGLIKGVLWGWNGDHSKTYGGAQYTDNDVPDINADTMIEKCSNVSSNFNNIKIGEVVWTDGHIGVYIGNGLAVECSPRWANDVQITAVGNIGKKKGYNTRMWEKHGKLPYVSYGESSAKKYGGTFPKLPERGYFQNGDKGTQVKNLQKLLNWCVASDLVVDGIIGAKTISAVKSFQQKYSLKVDGLFGEKSLAKAKTIKK